MLAVSTIHSLSGTSVSDCMQRKDKNNGGGRRGERRAAVPEVHYPQGGKGGTSTCLLSVLGVLWVTSAIQWFRYNESETVCSILFL